MICEYGCGEEAKYQLKNGKWCCLKSQNCCSNIRKKNSESQNKLEIKEKKSRGLKEKWNNPRTRQKYQDAASSLGRRLKLSKSIKKTMVRPDVKQRHKDSISQNIEKWRKAGKEVNNRPEIKEQARIRMLNGGGSYAASFVRKTSWPQIKTFNNVKELYPKSIMNYVIKIFKRKWYVLDIVILSLMINIEYDGNYWHEGKGECDKQRDNNLRNRGWRILRYRDHVPTKEQLKEDINSILRISDSNKKTSISKNSY
jgi:hypothetical protein